MLNLLTVLSLLICVAVCVLWVRSYFVAELVAWDLREYRGMLGVVVSRGRVMVCRGYEPFGSSMRMHKVNGWAQFSEWPPVTFAYARGKPWLYLDRAAGVVKQLDYWRRPMFGDNRRFWPGGRRAAPAPYETHLDAAGFVYQTGHEIYLPPPVSALSSPRPVGRLTHRAVVVPMWFVAIASALPAATSAAHRLRYRGRTSHRLCPRCRYDLTGNVSGVCPECGTEARGI